MTKTEVAQNKTTHYLGKVQISHKHFPQNISHLSKVQLHLCKEQTYIWAAEGRNKALQLTVLC